MQRANTIPAALRLFGSVFQREADRRLLEQIEARRGELSAVLEGDPLDGLDMDDPDGAVETLAAEYCRVFIGPRGHLHPVESVVLGEGRFWGPSTEKVAEFYKAAGLAPAEDSRMLPDHISMELDCLAQLEEGDRHDEAVAFARGHILRWLPALTQHVQHVATTAFYQVWSRGLQAMLTELYDECQG